MKRLLLNERESCKLSISSVQHSSNTNKVIRAVLNFLLLFFNEKILHATKAPKAPKRKNATKQKHKNANKQTIVKNVLKKHVRGKQSLIRLFAFLCFLCVQRKENRK